MEYESQIKIASQLMHGVVFTVARVSFGRRLELLRRIRELTQKVEFLKAGEDARERIEAILLASQIDELYLNWGLLGIDGLQLDGGAATPASLLALGPEDLCREALGAVKSQFGLTEEERKN